MSSDRVKRWRETTKARIVEIFGGACQLCGYDRCDWALEFHHKDPTKKDFSLGQVRATPTSWAKVVPELLKCVMLCANCHREVHAGVVGCAGLSGPDPFLLAGAYSNIPGGTKTRTCIVCGAEFTGHSNRKTCSQACAGKRRGKVDWTLVDIADLLDKHGSYVAVGKHLGVSDNAVRKQMKKIEYSGVAER